MRARNIAAAVSAFALCVACVFGATACSGDSVAATVNGVKIQESTITNDIQSYRTAYGMSDADTWGQYLAYYSYTPETIRKSMIDSYVQKEIVKEQAEAEGITVEDSEIDAYVNSIKAYYDSDEAWQSALKQAGFTEQQYRDDVVKMNLLQQKLMEKVCPATDPSDEDIMTYLSMYAQYSFDGSKKSSHILFDASDTETAQKVLDQINAGTITFEDAAKQYSKDSSASNGGNVGWDCLNTFADAYQTALDNLEVGKVSALVTSDYGIHIIKCTEQFTCPSEVTSVDQVPSEMVDTVRSQVKSTNQSSSFNTWLEGKTSEANVTINDMPKNLPYDVDMSKCATNTNTTNTTTTTDSTNTNADASSSTNENANAASNENANANNNNAGSSN